MRQRRCLIGEALLDHVEVRAIGATQSFDLVERQIGEEFEKAHHIGILGVAPELPVVVGRQAVFVDPDGAGRRLAHLDARGGRQKRRGHAEDLRALDASHQIDATHDVAPLVAAAELQPAAGAAEQFEVVDRLQDHVVELEEARVFLLLQPRPDAVEGEHAIDGEVFADVPEHVDPGHPVEPLGIVDHDGIGRAVAEGQQPLEHFPDAGDIG
ncbi:hypothetical protein D9M72_475470 [compost metagenome]